jgi:hypothetical protein
LVPGCGRVVLNRRTIADGDVARRRPAGNVAERLPKGRPATVPGRSSPGNGSGRPRRWSTGPTDFLAVDAAAWSQPLMHGPWEDVVNASEPA